MVQLSALTDWSVFDDLFSALHHSDWGSLGKPTRLTVGLLHLKLIDKFSDEQLVNGWPENPYWQCFFGESHFQTEWPIDPSKLTRHHQSIGKSSCEWLLALTIETGILSVAVRRPHLK